MNRPLEYCSVTSLGFVFCIFFTLQEELNIPKPLGSMEDDPRLLVRQELASRERWLLVFHSANSADMLKHISDDCWGYLPPAGSDGNVVIITQQMILPLSLERRSCHMTVSAMDIPSSMVLVYRCANKQLGLSAQRFNDDQVLRLLDELRRASQSEWEALRMICGKECLAGHPHALEHAGYHVGNTSSPYASNRFNTYFSMFKSLRMKLFRSNTIVPTDRPLALILGGSVERIREPAARQLLTLVSFLSPTCVPYKLLLLNWRILPECVRDYLCATNDDEETTPNVSAAEFTISSSSGDLDNDVCMPTESGIASCSSCDDHEGDVLKSALDKEDVDKTCKPVTQTPGLKLDLIPAPIPVIVDEQPLGEMLSKVNNTLTNSSLKYQPSSETTTKNDPSHPDKPVSDENTNLSGSSTSLRFGNDDASGRDSTVGGSGDGCGYGRGAGGAGGGARTVSSGGGGGARSIDSGGGGGSVRTVDSGGGVRTVDSGGGGGGARSIDSGGGGGARSIDSGGGGGARTVDSDGGGGAGSIDSGGGGGARTVDSGGGGGARTIDSGGGGGAGSIDSGGGGGARTVDGGGGSRVGSGGSSGTNTTNRVSNCSGGGLWRINKAKLSKMLHRLRQLVSILSSASLVTIVADSVKVSYCFWLCSHTGWMVQPVTSSMI